MRQGDRDKGPVLQSDSVGCPGDTAGTLPGAMPDSICRRGGEQVIAACKDLVELSSGIGLQVQSTIDHIHSLQHDLRSRPCSR